MTTPTPAMKMPKLTQEHVNAAMDFFKKYFPEEEPSLTQHATEISQHVLNGTRPAETSPLRSVAFAPVPQVMGLEMIAQAPRSKCIDNWGAACVDTVLFVISLTGLRTKLNERQVMEVVAKIDNTSMDGLTVALKKIEDAKYLWKKGLANGTKDWDALKTIAKGFFGIVSGIYHMSLLHLFWDALKNDMSWWDWVKDGIIAVATLLAWFATAGVAFVAECVLVLMSAITTIQAYVKADDTCSLDEFVDDLEGKTISAKSTPITSGATSVPSVSELNNTYFVISHDGATGLEFIKSSDGVNWSSATSIEGVTQCNSWPASAAYNGKLYVFYTGNENPGQIWYVSTSDGTTWSAPANLGTNTTDNAPSVTVFDDKLYVIYKGSGTNTKIWYTYYDGSSWSSIEELPAGVNTSTTPCPVVYNKKLTVIYKGEAGDDRIWLVTYDGSNWGTNTHCLDKVTTGDTPTAYVDGENITVFFRGTGDDHNVWKIEGSSLAAMQGAYPSSTTETTTVAPTVASLPQGPVLYYSLATKSFQYEALSLL